MSLLSDLACPVRGETLRGYREAQRLEYLLRALLAIEPIASPRWERLNRMAARAGRRATRRLRARRTGGAG